MNLYDRIESLPDTLPVSWKPKERDLIVGTVAGYEQGETMYGPVTILLLDEEDREGSPTGDCVSVWLAHKVLWDEVRRLRPLPGERIAIRRNSDHPHKNYKRYTVIVDRKETNTEAWKPDWDRGDPGLKNDSKSKDREASDPESDASGGAGLAEPTDDLPF